MIVSASYRTDIPAFYGPWFLRRFEEGFAKVVNPYGGPPSTVPLQDGVDGFVFWTRNARPFRPALAAVRGAGLPFVVQYTITGYPRALESKVIEAGRAVDDIRALATEFGARAVVWRYDPIVLSSLTPAGFHRDTFARLADGLAGSVDECCISFANIYKKTRRTMDAAARADQFSWEDPPGEAKRLLAQDLAGLAAARGLALTLCSQETYLVPGIAPAACADVRRLEDVAAGWGIERRIKARIKGNRPGCFCAETRDIGAYDSCPHGCAYCYAVTSRPLARRRFADHDPEGDFLIPPPASSS